MNANRTNRFALAFATFSLGFLPIAASADVSTGNSKPADPKPSPSAAAADFDLSGQVEIRDFFAFLQAWASHDKRADADGDGALTIHDIYAFLAVWMAQLQNNDSGKSSL